MKKFLIGIPLALGVACVPLSTIAAPVVRTIKQTQASGQGAILQTINVWNGHGVAISFYEIGETIKKVWLDDPSQILIDTDGCLEGLDQNCSKGGAGLIHLRRIKRVNIPGIPQTSATLLTVVTQLSSGERKTYSFRLATSNGTPKYSQVTILLDVAREQTAPKPQLQSLVKTQQTINRIRGGIVVAIKSGWILQQDELHQRLQKLIGYLQAGDDISNAANKASVSQELAKEFGDYADVMTCAAILSSEQMVKRLMAASLNPWVKIAFGQLFSSAASEKTVAGIVATASIMFTRFMAKNTLGCFIGKTTLPLEIKGKQMIIFGLDRERRDAVGPLMTSILHMTIARNIAKKRLDPLIVALDELPSIYLPDLYRWLNESRSEGFCGIIGFQNMGQLEKNYGKDIAKAILGACSTKFIFNLVRTSQRNYSPTSWVMKRLSTSKKAVLLGVKIIARASATKRKLESFLNRLNF